jgi:hypothetical protein
MYPDIIPKYEVAKTISSPFDTAAVIGFEARNVRLGRDAIVLKGSEVIEQYEEKQRAELPGDLVDRIVSDGLELAVLGDEKVWCIKGMDLHSNTESKSVSRNGTTEFVESFSLDNKNVRSFFRFQVEVQN